MKDITKIVKYDFKITVQYLLTTLVHSLKSEYHMVKYEWSINNLSDCYYVICEDDLWEGKC